MMELSSARNKPAMMINDGATREMGHAHRGACRQTTAREIERIVVALVMCMNSVRKMRTLAPYKTGADGREHALEDFEHLVGLCLDAGGQRPHIVIGVVAIWPVTNSQPSALTA